MLNFVNKEGIQWTNGLNCELLQFTNNKFWNTIFSKIVFKLTRLFGIIANEKTIHLSSNEEDVSKCRPQYGLEQWNNQNHILGYKMSRLKKMWTNSNEITNSLMYNKTIHENQMWDINERLPPVWTEKGIHGMYTNKL